MELEQVAPLLQWSGASALAWRRVRSSSIAETEAAAALQNTRRIQAVEQLIRERQIAELVSSELAECQPILAKGWACARLYREPGLRRFTDIDFFVRPERRIAAAAAIAAFVPADPERAIPVDLQDTWDDLPERKWDEVERRVQLVRVGDATVRLLDPENTLRLCAIHFLKHLGIYRIPMPLWLCDIGVQVESAGPDFDWDYCLSGSRRHGDWIAAVIELSKRLLEADDSRCPPAVRRRWIPGWFADAAVRSWGEEAAIPNRGQAPRPMSRVLRENPRAAPSELMRRFPGELETMYRWSLPVGSLGWQLMRPAQFVGRGVKWIAGRGPARRLSGRSFSLRGTRRRLDWIVRAGETRRSRLHDYDGRLVPVSALRDLPVVVAQSFLRRTSGRLPAQPWIPYPAIRRLTQIIRADWRVLETGSGSSTIWLAARVQHVHSVESDRAWYERIRAKLPRTATYRYVDVGTDPERYWTIDPSEYQQFDLVIVDGLHRSECARTALLAVRPGGYIYVDNVDTAGRDALDRVRNATDNIELLTGFPPAQPNVTTGALAQINPNFDGAGEPRQLS